jgi:FkbM family methyltransferase
MNPMVKKGLRTLQSEFPFLKEAKDAFYYKVRSLLSIPHERDFKALKYIGRNSEKVLIDVGANQGQSIESMMMYMPASKIVSFEANPNLAQKLHVRYENIQQIRVLARGLSDSAGTYTLYIPSYKGFVYDGLASLDKNQASSWISKQTIFGFDPSRLKVAEVICQVNTLDAEQLAPFFLKVDVQGYEYNVLKGGVETLRTYEPVLLIESYRNDPRTVRLANALGYEEYNFDNGSLKKGPPRRSPNSFLVTRGTAKTLLR